MKIVGCELSPELYRIVEDHIEHFKRERGGVMFGHLGPVSCTMKIVLEDLVRRLSACEAAKKP